VGWRERFQVSHSVERDTDDLLVLRHNWQGAVALGLGLAVLGSPFLIGALLTSDDSSRLLLGLVSLACPGGGIALAAFGFARRNSLTVVDRAAQVVRWGSRTVPFSEIEGVVLRTKQTREGTDRRGLTVQSSTFELVARLRDGAERKIMTGVRHEALSHVAQRIIRLTGTSMLPAN
jgi:hypothetical protein